VNLTIAIRAHNAAARLPGTLAALAAMKVPLDLAWECLVVNNASSDDTAAVAESHGRRLSLPMRVVDEPVPGNGHAYRKCAQEARGDLISFVDDDNHVAPDWAVRCVEFFRDHPRAGLAGGKIDPIFEDPASVPADFAERYAMALAIRDMGPVEKQLIPPADDPPCGAGLTGRTALFRQVLLEIGLHLTGRTGTSLAGGEDTEVALLIGKLGWEFWYTPTLKMGHVLPPRRLKPDYLDRLIVAGASVTPWLDYLRGREKRRGPIQYRLISLYWRLAAMKIELIGVIKGKNHPLASRFPFWTGLYRERANGYLDLARKNPGRILEVKLGKKISPRRR
jgi:glycosyltransferase involved in cell wall biosynthesis